MDDRAARGETTPSEQEAYPLRFSATASVAVLSPDDPRIDECARTIGLDGASLEFRQELTAAINLCLIVFGFDRKRVSEVRKEVLRVGKAAATTSRSLRELAATLTALGHASVPSLSHLSEEMIANDRRPIEIGQLIKEAEGFDCLFKIAQSHAKGLESRDRGGRPKFHAFNFLVSQLAAVYKRATGDDAKVTWNDLRNRFEGRFVRFVEAVLPKVSDLSQVSGRPIRCPPTEHARGAYIKEMTRAGAGKRRK